MHILDMENGENTTIVYYQELESIAFINNQLVITSSKKNIEIDIEKKQYNKAKNIALQITALQLSKEVLYPKALYRLESFKTLETRYNGFGLPFYYKLKTVHPDIFNKLKFYQPLKDKEDSFSEYVTDRISFFIDLDFYSEKIIIGTNYTVIEIGTWEKDPTKTAFDYILNEYFPDTT